MRPERVTLWRRTKTCGMEINYSHPLSDGYGIPAIVVRCPIQPRFSNHDGMDEYGCGVEGISFDECIGCCYFGGLDLSQAIMCRYQP